MPEWTVLEGDCVEAMRGMDEASVDAIVTDPPAGISFMGKEWDSNRGSRNAWIAWLTEVMEEAHRVLKPGAHGLVWALPRTSHWTAMALEDAGFEVRERITHHFGSGFPKSKSMREIGRPELGSALKPATEDWWMIRKPLSESSIARQVLSTGTGALNVDASRICSVGPEPNARANKSHHDPEHSGYHKNYQSQERSWGASGRFPANLVFTHHEDCKPLGERRVRGTNTPKGTTRAANNGYEGGWGDRDAYHYNDPDGLETVEAYACHPSCVVGILDRQSGTSKSAGGRIGNKDGGGIYGGGKGLAGAFEKGDPGFGDSGGASRFFMRFPGETPLHMGYNSLEESCGEKSTKVESTSAGRKAEGRSDSLPIGGSGSKSTDQSPKATKSITGTATNSTTNSQTSNSSPQNGTMITTSGSERTISISEAWSIAAASGADNISPSRSSRDGARELTTDTVSRVPKATSESGRQTTESGLTNSPANPTTDASSPEKRSSAPIAESSSSLERANNDSALAPAQIEPASPRFFKTFGGAYEQGEVCHHEHTWACRCEGCQADKCFDYSLLPDHLKPERDAKTFDAEPGFMCEICGMPDGNGPKHGIMNVCQGQSQSDNYGPAGDAALYSNPEQTRVDSVPGNAPELFGTSPESASGAEGTTSPTGAANDSALGSARERIPRRPEGREQSENILVPAAENDSGSGLETVESIAPVNVRTQLEEQLVQHVSDAANLCNSCATAIAQRLARCVAEKSTSSLGPDSTPICKNSILTQSLASFAEPWVNTGTTPTTQSLSILFGYVRLATREYTARATAGDPSTHPGFLYKSKSSRAERNAGLEGMPEASTRRYGGGKIGPSGGQKPNGHADAPETNTHPTVKPIALMRYLVRLITPPGGTVLDPFTGSGSTGCAAILEGFDFIGVEKEPEYVEIARRRIAHWSLPEYERPKVKAAKARNTYGFKSTDVQRRCPKHGESIPSGSTTYKCGCKKTWYKVEPEADEPEDLTLFADF